MYSSVWSCDEWSPLKEIIVGTLKDYKQYNHYSHYCKDNSFLDDIYSEVQEGLDTFQNILEKNGVKVYRPHGLCYNVRDCAIVIGDTIVEAPMRYREEYHFLDSLKPIFYNKMLMGAKWISAPKPTWKNINEPIFDGANICRLGDEMIFSVNETANRDGREWIQKVFPDINLHYVSQHAKISHIDTTYVPLSKDTVMINGERVTKIHDVFKDWNHIIIERDDLVDEDVSTMNRCAGIFIGMNTLSLNQRDVFVNASQTKLIEKLEKHNFNCIEVPLKHTRLLSGGLHCCTLDLVRES